MQGCNYKEVNKCKECKSILYSECQKFRVAHAAFLSKDIRPMKVTIFEPTRIAWSRDMDKAKSNALHCALKLNSPVKKLSCSQVINLTISNEEIEGRVFYIECKNKPTGDPEKVSNVIQSFIEKIEYEGGCVSIFVGPSVVLNFNDYKRL